VQTDDVLTLLQEVAEELVTPRFGALAKDQVSRKDLVAPVTVADREAEARITEVLQGAYPGALLLGEEAVTADPTMLARFRGADHAFTIDPVDGTRQFVRGSPDHAVMLAELWRGEVVRSWVWQPQHRRAYVAERGAGAWADGHRLEPRQAGAALDVTGRRPVARAAAVVRDLRVTGTCCGVDYPRLCEGAADYALYWRPRPWDHAPGSLLLAECGGVVGGVDGRPYRPQADRPRVLVAAGCRATYDLVGGVVGLLPGM
jgi:fructose-1,6-bisphosphatase/inositol monophosphatase family enzyme